MLFPTHSSQQSPAFQSSARVSAGVDVRVPTGAPPMHQLVQKRLEISRRGLTELRGRLAAGAAEEAAVLLSKIDEDLRLLQWRVRREAERTAPRSIPVRKEDVHGGPGRPR
jgi:hypothetical protein